LTFVVGNIAEVIRSESNDFFGSKDVMDGFPRIPNQEMQRPRLDIEEVKCAWVVRLLSVVG
jgi:hypothetical protein